MQGRGGPGPQRHRQWAALAAATPMRPCSAALQLCVGSQDSGTGGSASSGLGISARAAPSSARRRWRCRAQGETREQGRLKIG